MDRETAGPIGRKLLAYIAWSPVFSVGDPVLDAQHQGLVELLDAFHEACRAGRGRDHVYRTLNQLVRYAESHFAEEERLMEERRYPACRRHRAEHERLLKQVFELNESFARGDEEADGEVMEFLKTWLLDHILGWDKQYAPYMSPEDPS